MRKAGMAVMVAAFGLQGCAGAVVYGESRKVSRDLLLPVVATDLSAYATEAATECILKGMTVTEVLTLPNSTTGKTPDGLRALVAEVAARDGVPACLAAAGAAAG